MEKQWKVRAFPEGASVWALQRATGLSELVCTLLAQRGITNPKPFLHPTLDSLHSPWLMADMDAAVDRLTQALNNKQRIVVYGDYDVDGTTAVALVTAALQRLAYSPDLIEYYIPDRYEEGYGISDRSLHWAAQRNVRLMVCLDCGIKSTQAAIDAAELGIDLIICDHHLPSPPLPPAIAVLDPLRDDCTYPFKSLSGCGVGYKLMCALYQSLAHDTDELNDLLDLLTVSIASDIMPVIDENRILCHHGLKLINTAPRQGLRALLQASHIQPGKCQIADLVFKVGPRINAAGRMGAATDAVRLLLTNSPIEADKLTTEIESRNEARKDVDRRVTKQAVTLVTAHQDWREAHTTVVYEPSWSKGVVGIVASRLAEAYHRPTVVLTKSPLDEHLATGSARCNGGFDLYQAIEATGHLLTNYGGHTYAAGLTMPIENVPAFRIAFEQEVSYRRPNNQTELLDIDLQLPLNALPTAAELHPLAPFGPGNQQPLFLLRNVFDYGTSKLIGRQQQHIKMDIIDTDSRQVLSGVAYNLGHKFPLLLNGGVVDVAVAITEEGIQIKDIRQAQ